jgi:multisubunit Na+/H+ antiporter MnhB subunit
MLLISPGAIDVITATGARASDGERQGPGPWGGGRSVGEMMLGMVVVGLIAGIFVGRHTTKSKRSFADQKSARVTYEKYRKAMFVDTRNAVVAVAVVGAFLIALFMGMLNYPD